MNNHFLLKTFEKETEVQDFIEFLNKNAFHYVIQRVNVDLIPFLQLSANHKFGLFIKNSDLIQLEKVIDGEFNDLNIEGHPLAELTTDELLNVLERQDEWSVEDVITARRILSKRGRTVSDGEILEYKQKRLDELSQQVKGSNVYFLLGFLIPVFAIFTIGRVGMLGFIVYCFSYGIAINFMLDYNRLPNGEKVKVYQKKTRHMGLAILLWTIVVTIGSVLFFIVLNS